MRRVRGHCSPPVPQPDPVPVHTRPRAAVVWRWARPEENRLATPWKAPLVKGTCEQGLVTQGGGCVPGRGPQEPSTEGRGTQTAANAPVGTEPSGKGPVPALVAGRPGFKSLGLKGPWQYVRICWPLIPAPLPGGLPAQPCWAHPLYSACQTSGSVQGIVPAFR